MAIEFLGDILTPSIQLGELQSNGTDTITLKAPDDLTSGSSTYTLPLTYPTTSGFVLSSLTNGTMSWVVGGGGSGTNIGDTNLTTTDANRTLRLFNASSDFSILASDGSAILKCEGDLIEANGMLVLKSTSTQDAILRLYEPNATGTNYIQINTPAISQVFTYGLPTVYPTTSGDSLVSTTTGDMSWAANPKNYKNTIVSNQTNLVSASGQFSAGDYYFRGSQTRGWANNEWAPYPGTYNASTGWESQEIAMGGIKVGSIPASGRNGVTLNASLSVDASVLGGGTLTGKIYIYQYNCATVMAASHNAKLVPLQSDMEPFSIANSQNDAGTCISKNFGVNASMVVGDYYMIVVLCSTSNLSVGDPVWFNYSITQTETLS
jgi:hypothetical protein